MVICIRHELATAVALRDRRQHYHRLPQGRRAKFE
jgi:hypothetical protein